MASRERSRTRTRSKRRRQPRAADLIVRHFKPLSLADVTISSRTFPYRVRADLQRAIERVFDAASVVRFTGVHKEYSPYELEFANILGESHSSALAIPPQYEDVDIGSAEPVRCLKVGLWLLRAEGVPHAVLLSPNREYHEAVGVKVQIAAPQGDAGTRLARRLFAQLEESVQRSDSYRGKILSLEKSENSYSGKSSGIRVHKLRPVARDEVILPARTLDLLDRNVIRFVQIRQRLAAMHLSTRKGLLFYGPPGTGKTHTIHYLAGALPGHTTLIIAAEQIALLDEYMILARLLQPSLVVIEDADLVARDRNSRAGPCDEALLNKLLNEMDGLREDADILFLLTTNRPQELEAALASRPGRVDQAIEFPLPDDAGREKLVQLYARGSKLDRSLVAEIVKRTDRVSAAFIKELMRRAAQYQIERNGTGPMQLADVDSALDEMLVSGGTLNQKLLGAER